MGLSTLLGRAYRHPILDFIVGMVLMAACLIELDQSSSEPLRLAHALALLGMLHLVRGAVPILTGEEERAQRESQPTRDRALAALTFTPPKALPPPLPNNILSMEQAKGRRLRRRAEADARSLEALPLTLGQTRRDAQSQGEA